MSIRLRDIFAFTAVLIALKGAQKVGLLPSDFRHQNMNKTETVKDSATVVKDSIPFYTDTVSVKTIKPTAAATAEKLYKTALKSGKRII